MPFSLKNFKLPRSTSMPSAAHKAALDDKKQQQCSIDDNKKENIHSAKHPSLKTRDGSTGRVSSRKQHSLVSSRSVDSAELRRVSFADSVLQDDRGGRRPPNYRPPPPPGQTDSPVHKEYKESSGHSRRSAKSAKNTCGSETEDTDVDSYYGQVSSNRVRRLILKKNGVRFMDNSTISEEMRANCCDGIPPGHAPSSGNHYHQSSDVNNCRGEHRRYHRSQKREADSRRHHTIVGGESHGQLRNVAAAAANFNDSMDLESHTYNQQWQQSMYQSQSSMYDDDPGILSEVETSSTGFRRGAKIRTSLPIVRTPSKSLERPLGVVFLQFRTETKRAVLPNEVTSMDTVKALFVRSFSKQLSMEFLDSPHLRVYIHDPAKDMFYELEDLRDIKDRSVLRIYEQDIIASGGSVNWDQDISYFSEPEFDSEFQHQHIHRAKRSQPPGSSNYYGNVNQAHSQTLPHHHRTPISAVRPMSPASSLDRQKMMPTPQQPAVAKQQRPVYQPSPTGPKVLRTGQPHAGSNIVPSARGGPVGGGIERRHEPQGAYRTPNDYVQSLTSPDRRLAYDSSPDHHRPRSVHDPGYHSSPERSRIDYLHHKSYPSYGGMASSVEDGYFSDRGGYPITSASTPAGTRSGSVTPIIDEEARIRVQNMERQLASLTGIVQKALSTPSPSGSRPQSLTQEFGEDPTRDYSSDTAMFKGDSRVSGQQPMESPESSSSTSTTEEVKPCNFAPSRHSFREEKSVSFSDEPTALNSPSQKQYSPQRSVEKPTKSAIKSSSSRHSHSDKDGRSVAPGSSKPAPPPKPTSLTSSYNEHKQGFYKDSGMNSEMYSQLKILRKKSKELKSEAKNLKKITQAQALNVRETIKDTSLKIKTMLSTSHISDEQRYSDRMKVSREEECYRQDVSKLEKDLAELEGSVEELRSNVINRRIRVNMSDVEGMALILSKASKTVADLKARFPSLQDNLKVVMAAEMEVIVKEEKFLKEEPERLENALRRCKKLTGTLVTLKRLASVQEQRHSGNTAIVSHTQSMPERDEPHTNTDGHSQKTETNINRIASQPTENHQKQHQHKPENVLDALLDELQTFSKPHDGRRAPQNTDGPAQQPLKRLPSYPSTDSPSKGPPPPPKTSIGKHNSLDGSSKMQWNMSKSADSSAEVYSSKVTVGPLKQPSLDHSKGEDHSSKKLPPPPPPRTSSKSPVIVSPSSPAGIDITKLKGMVTRSNSEHKPHENVRRTNSLKTTLSVDGHPMKKHMSKEDVLKTCAISDENIPRDILSSNSSSSESVNSQEGLQTSKSSKVNGTDEDKKTPTTPPSKARQALLEQRHQDLLKKQKQLQEQYAKLQQIQRGQLLTRFSPPRVGIPLGDLKKTGSESNILSKANLSLAPVPSGSLTHLALASATLPSSDKLALANALLSAKHSAALKTSTAPNSTSTSPSKIFETDIL